jgi:hypothetical protein
VKSRWSASDEVVFAGWSHEERESRVVFARLEEWRGFAEKAPVCALCHRQNFLDDPTRAQIRVTPVGELCLRCWLDWPACEVCGTGPIVVDEYIGNVSAGWRSEARGDVLRAPEKVNRGIFFRGKRICADCLVPEIHGAWSDWLRWFFATPKSSYLRVFEAYPLTWGASA